MTSGKVKFMDDKQPTGKEGDMLSRLESLSKGELGVPHEDFERMLREFGNITISEWHKVVKFTSDQLGLWEAEWLFSPIHSPNTFAEEEVTGWQMISQVCINALVERVPEIKGDIERQQRLISVRCIVERRMDYNKTRLFQRVTASVLSRISIGLSRLGFKNIAEQLYATSLYPPGTVGRSKK